MLPGLLGKADMPSCNTIRTSSPRRGAVTIFVAFALVGILAVVAIAVDGGVLMDKRRHVQATADAVALAAADLLYTKYRTYKGLDSDGAALAQALRTAADNGYANDKTTSVVSMRFAPELYADGPDKGKMIPAGYVEVILQYNQKRYFSLVFGSKPVPVIARAVARGTFEAGKNGIIVLDLDDKGALTTSGNGTFDVANASVLVNSNNAEAAISNGTGSLTAPEFDIVGGYSGSGFSGTITTGTLPVADPLRYLPPPDPTTMTVRSTMLLSISGGTYTLSPGVYRGGISIQGSAKVTMEPGIYYIDGGGFTYKGQGSLVGYEVMIYNDPKSDLQSEGITGTGGGSVTLTPPTTGIYQGISFYQERNSNVDVIFAGNGSFNIAGTFYCANALVRTSGNGDAAIGSQYISRALAITGNGNVNIVWNPNSVAPVRVLQLVQ
jgi:hypothetical protein